MGKPQSISIRTKEKGFSLIECLIVILLISSLSIFSIKSLDTLTNKVKKMDVSDKFGELMYGFAYLIYECSDMNFVTYENQLYLMGYPIRSDYCVGDYPDEKTETDIMAYDKVCNVYLKRVFNKVSGFENGEYTYEPVNTFKASFNVVDNIITYTCSEGVVNVYIKLKKFGTGSYEKAWIRTIEYINNDGVSRTFKI